LLLAAAGGAILLTQYVAVREIGSTFFSTELIAIVAVLVTLLGPSVGYALADRIGDRPLAVWGTISIALQLALPFGLRALVGALAPLGLEVWVLLSTVFAGGLALGGFYAVFLPRMARAAPALPVMYAIELGGALVALAWIALSPSWRALLAVYWALAVLVVQLGVRRATVTVIVGLAAVLALATYPSLDRWATVAYMRGVHGHDHPVVRETEYSPYQRIDVIDDGPQRFLYLDGVLFFGTAELGELNGVLAGVPARLGPTRGRAVVVGSGSFQSAALVRRAGLQVTVVELDPAVARLGFRHFRRVHRLAPGDVRVVTRDARRFFEDAPRGAYDLVVLDVPAPYHAQTALLHTPDFYRLVASRLRPRGVASLTLCDDLDGDVGGAIAASAAAAFGQLIAVESAGADQAFVYAGSSLPFDAARVAGLLASGPTHRARVLDDRAVRGRARGHAPVTARDLGAVLLMARAVLPGASRDR